VTPGKAQIRKLNWPGILEWTGSILYIMLVAVPLCALVFFAAEFLVQGNIPTFSARQAGLLFSSIGLALAVALAGMILGFLSATFLWRFETGLPSFLRWLVLVFVPLPGYIHALAWSSTMQNLGSLVSQSGVMVIPFEGWAASWWVQVMSFLPLATGICLLGLKSIEPVLFDAARIMRSNIGSLFRVVVPVVMPALMAGFGILFLLSITDYSIPYLFQMNVYSLEIFAQFSAGNNPGSAFLYALPLVLVTVAVVGLSQYWLKNIGQSKAWNKPSWEVKPGWPNWFRILQWLAMAIMIVEVALPLISLTTNIGTWQNMAQSINSGQNEIFYSVWISVLAAVLCLPLAVSSARLIKRLRAGNWLWWLIVLVPLAVPPPLAGIALITVWNTPFPGGIYGTAVMPVVAALFRFTSLATIIMVMQFRYVDPLLIDAARILQRGRFQTPAKIWLPMLLPGLLAAACIVLAFTTGELGATLLVAAPGQATLTIRIYNFLHYGASSTVAGLCVLIVLITFAMALAAMIVFSWWSRINRNPVDVRNDRN
jgi:iron(III) transport system permease protein